MSNSSILSDVSQPITWLIVVLGWWIVNRQNNKRELRKEIRANINSIVEWLDSIESEAIKHHTGTSFNPELTATVRHSISRISARIQRLPFENPQLPTTIKKFRQAITLRNFDSNSFASFQENSTIVINITTSKDALIDELETSFCHKFPA